MFFRKALSAPSLGAFRELGWTENMSIRVIAELLARALARVFIGASDLRLCLLRVRPSYRSLASISLIDENAPVGLAADGRDQRDLNLAGLGVR